MGDSWLNDEYPDDWQSRSRSIKERDGHKCQKCGCYGGPRGNSELHAHHKTPISDGGSHKQSNLTTLCRDCHNDIHDNHIPSNSTDNGTEPNVFGEIFGMIALAAMFVLLNRPKLWVSGTVILSGLYVIAFNLAWGALLFLSSMTFFGIIYNAGQKGGKDFPSLL